MRIIEKTTDLEVLCQELKQQQFITVDSEFVREKTYYSQLCLIQVGWLDDAAIIDPLAPDIKLDAFFDILQNKNILKVFHSGRQDIEIFYNLTGKTPYPIFDTQIAGMVCGFGPSISYDNLVRAITKVELDKSSRLTDWSKRPLEAKQLEYALRDVTFLIPCYQYLDKHLKEQGREHWIDEETAFICDANLYEPDPENMWQRIRHSIHSLQFLAILKDLAAWREHRALKHNTPRQTLVRDEMLVNIAAAAPKSLPEMKRVRNIRSDVAGGKLGAEMVEVINETLSHPFSSELRKIDREKDIQIPASTSALIEVLKLLLRIKSEQLGVVARLIACEKDLRDIACGNNDKTNPALLDWRYDIFGKYALAFRKGKACIGYDTVKKDIVISEVTQTQDELAQEQDNITPEV